MSTVYFGDGWIRSERGLLVPPRRRGCDCGRPHAVELFAGAGGFSYGFHQAGWHVIAAAEYDVAASLTYLANLARPGVRIHTDPTHPVAASARSSKPAKRKTARTAVPFEPHIGTGWIAGEPDDPGCRHFYLYNVRNLTGQRILDDLGLDEVECVFGGPPCQGFSVAGKQDVMDPRNCLIFDFARIVCEIRPKTFVIENVPGLLKMRTPEGIPVVDALALAMSRGGYGEYEPLRRALGATDTARAGMRDAVKKPSAAAADAAVDDELALFEVTP
ncbi:DNA cytosine methyltransferase [Mycobacterium sp. MYCO198283]|uniref:DNA cytosine methyltransferase n=1 Tax=Mycobacterium sp. MYCO198283 TaxID=2883505 RepID=UPI001E58F256|nr:DNA cytosine methyltransferase [Mycobacterium sp. MYCO198283]MCG5431211.1 DNA cytosine methyltransferase [Mycobacterium sp. MYCO198283]